MVVAMNTRVGWSAGVIGFALLFAAQVPAALGASLLFAPLGLAAGLGMAKWLPRAWYGRQFRAGLRTGAVAGSGAAAGLLLSAVLTAPHAMTVLAARSQLLGLRLSGQVYALRGLGWFGVTLVCAVLGDAICAALAGLVTQAVAFDKSRHAIQVVDRAREAAQRSNRVAAMTRPTRHLRPTPPPGVVLGQAGDQRGQITHAPVPNPWAEPARFVPSGPLDLGAEQSRELHEALAAWAGTTGPPAVEPSDAGRYNSGSPATQPAETEVDPADNVETPLPESKPGNWLC
jgi:hypothetical protein